MAVISKIEAVLLQDGNRNHIHITSKTEYPKAKSIPLPSNVEDINDTEKSRFSPARSRDISGSLISSNNSRAEFKTAHASQPADARIASYDCNGAVSLSSAMQTNVPDPFNAKGKSTHLNMPGGQWRQGQKYVSEDLNNSHPTNTKPMQGFGSSFSDVKKSTNNSYMPSTYIQYGLSGLLTHHIKNNQCFFSTSAGQEDKNTPTLSRKEKLKAAVKDYGAVVIVFHVGISLTSLGICYLAVTSGVDFTKILGHWESLDGAAANTAAPFIVAYAIHKSFAPLRITTTLVSVPFIVNYLRRVGIMKTPIPKK